MKKLFGIASILMLVAVFGFGATKAEARASGGYSQCVEVTHADYPSGLYCPSEQAKVRYIEILKSKIAVLQAQLSALQASL